MKEKIAKMNFIKIKNFCSVKDTVKKNKSQGKNIWKTHI